MVDIEHLVVPQIGSLPPKAEIFGHKTVKYPYRRVRVRETMR